MGTMGDYPGGNGLEHKDVDDPTHIAGKKSRVFSTNALI